MSNTPLPPFNELSVELGKLIQGFPFGDVNPPRERPHNLPIDGRTAGLKVLKRYIQELTFYRPDEEGKPPIPYRIPGENIYIEWPDYEQEIEFPSIVFLATGSGSYEALGLAGVQVDETTRDEFGQGTVLQPIAEYVETFALEIWASKRSERRSILAGLEASLVPTEALYGIRFIMPEFYNQTALFTVMQSRRIDDADGARGRRRAQIDLEMRFTIVTPVNYNVLTPTIKVNTDVDLDTNIAIPDPNADDSCDC